MIRPDGDRLIQLSLHTFLKWSFSGPISSGNQCHKITAREKCLQPLKYEKELRHFNSLWGVFKVHPSCLLWFNFISYRKSTLSIEVVIETGKRKNEKDGSGLQKNSHFFQAASLFSIGIYICVWVCVCVCVCVCICFVFCFSKYKIQNLGQNIRGKKAKYILGKKEENWDSKGENNGNVKI